MRRVGPAALVLSVFAAFLSVTISFPLAGALLGAVAFTLGALAVHGAHKENSESITGSMALGCSLLTVFALPFLLKA